MSIKWLACVNPEAGDDQKRRAGAMTCCKSERTATIGEESTIPGEENSQSQSQVRVNGGPAPSAPHADAHADDEKEQRKQNEQQRRGERRAAEKRNRAIERELRHTQRREEKFTHLLILGAHIPVLPARGTRRGTSQTACSETMSRVTRTESRPLKLTLRLRLNGQ